MIQVFWVVMLCSNVTDSCKSEGTYHLHLLRVLDSSTYDEGNRYIPSKCCKSIMVRSRITTSTTWILNINNTHTSHHEKSLAPARIWAPHHPDCSLVKIPTKLSWLFIQYDICIITGKSILLSTFCIQLTVQEAKFRFLSNRSLIHQSKGNFLIALWIRHITAALFSYITL